MRGWLSLVLLGSSLFSRPAFASETPTPLDHLGDHLAASFTGPPLAFHGGAVLSTVALSASGEDWHFRVNTQRHAVVDGYGDIAFYSGYGLPVFLGPGIWLGGWVARDSDVAGAGAAASQAALVATAVTVVLKVASGRPFPNHGMHPEDPERLGHPEYAQEFVPFRWGNFAWPSGHTSANVAVVAALTAYYPQQPWVPVIGYPLAVGIGLGMINGQHHWLSDVVAGALIGHAIGFTIGGAYRTERRDKTSHHRPLQRLQLVPLVGTAWGIGAVGWL